MSDGHKLLPSPEAQTVPTYADFASLPLGTEGDLAITLDTDSLYVFDGTSNAWKLIGNPDVVAAVSDTNTVDLTISSNTLSAVVRYQDSSSINLSDDTSGLKAELLLSASGANSGYFNASSNLRADGLQVEVPQAGVRSTPLTGFAAATGTVAATDTVLEAFDKLAYFESITSPAQVVTVAESGAMFSSVQDAVDSISDASSTKPYVIQVSPGIYTENVVSKEWIFIQNGLSGAVTILGQFSIAGTTGTAGLRGVTVKHTPTADGQVVADITCGVFYLVDCDIYLIGAADYAATGVKATSNTAFTVFNSTVWDRRTGNITKALTGWDFLGAGTFGIFNGSVSARCAYTAGTSCLYSIAQTGSLTMSGGAGIWASSAAFSGEIRGFCTTTATASPRIITGSQIRITGTSGGTGTASHLDSGGNSGRIDLSSCVFVIDGVTTSNITATDVTDSQRIYLTTTNKVLTKTGTGLASVTPEDLLQTGFIAWAGTGNYYSFVPATKKFTLLRPFIGMVEGSQVYVAANQEVTLPADYAAYFIYGDSNGVLQYTTDPGFTDKILCFSVYSDGTIYAVTKQTHPVSFPSAVSGAWHNALGSSLDNNANGVVTLLSGAGRTIQLVGATTYRDHGLNTTVADSGGAAISMKMLYTGASGSTFQGAVFTAIPAVRQNGTALSNTANGKFVNYRIGVMPSSNLSDAAADTIAQYIIVPDGTEHNSGSAAAAQITANTVASFPTVATGGLEVINIGFATIQGDGAGTGTLTVVTPAKQVFGVNFASGSSSSAGTVTTDTTTFDKNLSATDTSVQIALQTFDEFNALPNNSTNASASPDLTNKTAFASAASGTSATFTFGSRGAIEFLLDVNTDGGMTIACDYKATTINALSDPSGLFLATDAGTGIYISKSANSAAVVIKNRMGAAKTIGVLAVRSSLTATAWS
jgi:hypothetical protein